MRQVKFPDSFSETEEEKQNIAKLFLSAITKEKIQEMDGKEKEKIKEKKTEEDKTEEEEKRREEEERLKYFSKVFLEMVEEAERKKLKNKYWKKIKKINLKLIGENIS